MVGTIISEKLFNSLMVNSQNPILVLLKLVAFILITNSNSYFYIPKQIVISSSSLIIFAIYSNEAVLQLTLFFNSLTHPPFYLFLLNFIIQLFRIFLMDNQLSLPTPSILSPNNYHVNLQFSASLPSPGFTCKYDPDGEYIAIGCNNGEKILYSISQNKIIQQATDQNQMPITCIRWRPHVKSKAKVLGVCTADGRFEYWHIPSLKKMFTIQEKQNSILCCDFDSTGQRFATSGKDCNIRVYDQNTKSISSLLGKAEWNYSGHANRVFSLKFIDQNTIVSGGWDSVIHVWDIRHSKSIKSFYGPHLAGDSLDFKNNTILTGCYSSKNQIQLWDIRNFQSIESINWPCQKDQVAYVYSSSFGHWDKNSIVAGASGVNEVRVFVGQKKHETGLKMFNLNQGCYSVDTSYKNSSLCFVTSKQGFYIYSYS